MTTLPLEKVEVAEPAIAKLVALTVEEERIPAVTWRVLATVEEAEEINPESKDKVPLALNRLTSVSKPFCKMEKVKAP